MEHWSVNLVEVIDDIHLDHISHDADCTNTYLFSSASVRIGTEKYMQKHNDRRE